MTVLWLYGYVACPKPPCADHPNGRYCPILNHIAAPND